MQENFALSPQELFEEIVEQGVADGVNSKESYDMLVDEVMEAHLAVAELNDDQNLDGWADDLKARYPEYEVRFEEGG